MINKRVSFYKIIPFSFKVTRKEFQMKISREAAERNEYLNARMEEIHTGVSEEASKVHGVVGKMTSAQLELRKVLLTDHRDIPVEVHEYDLFLCCKRWVLPNPLPSSFITLNQFHSIFMPGLKGQLGASRNRIVCLSFHPFVCP